MSMKKYSVKVNGVLYDVEVEELAEGASFTPAPAAAAPAAPVAAAPAPAPEASAPATAPAAGTGEPVLAPINGTILSVDVKAGERVKRGTQLCLLEAMKMENEVYAPHDGVISAVHISRGSAVNAGDVMFSLQ